MKHPDDPSELMDQARGLGVDLGAEGARGLLRLEELLLERAVPLGLVAASDAPRIRERHLLDCLRAVLAVEAGDRLAVDLGSGAGLPGLVVALAIPHLRVILAESQRRRAAFLELACESLHAANAEVRHGRAEDLEGPVDLCFARAFAPLPAAWEVASGLLGPGGRLVYFAGAGFEGPVEKPGIAWSRTLEAAFLESAGPLVIMARQ